MADGAQPRRYSAFISYSQADAVAVRRLHRRIEAYRLPARLRTATGAPGGRLKPLFRDVDELSAGSDLSTAVQAALADSDFLIVACSPKSATSDWVGREIEVFRKLRGDGSVLTALLEGEPDTAFHPALRTGRRRRAAEPLAADFRPGSGAGRLALMKLVAPLAGVRLDDLVHRDGQRRMRQLLAGSVGALGAVGVVATLSIFALNARIEAAAQARRANGLSDFMVSDLRKGLEAAGRHDLLKQVNEAALKSFETADLSKLTPEQIMQLAKGLQGAAKDLEKSGDLKGAEAKAQAAYRLTGALLAGKPTDWKRLFAHAQSEYWVGFLDWRAGDSVGARARFQAYARLADRLVLVDPANDAGRMERVYAANNLGMLALRQAGDAPAAEPYYRRSLAELDTIIAHKPDDADALLGRANALAYLADIERLQGRLAEAATLREAQKSIFLGLLAKDPRNVDVHRMLLGYQLGVARIVLAAGDEPRAQSLLKVGRQQALDFAQQDPDNKDFPKQARMFELFEVKAWLDGPAGQRPAARKIADTLGDCAPHGADAVSQEISDFCGVLLARVRAMHGDGAGAATALAPVQAHLAKQHDVLTGRWGLNLVQEEGAVRLAANERN